MKNLNFIANVRRALSRLGWIDLALASPAILAFLIRFRVLAVAGLIVCVSACSKPVKLADRHMHDEELAGWKYYGTTNGGVDVWTKGDSVMCVADGTTPVKAALPANHEIVGFDSRTR